MKAFEESGKDLSAQALLDAASGMNESCCKLNHLVASLDHKLDETESRIEGLLPWVDSLDQQVASGYESARKRQDIEKDHLERIAALTEEFNTNLIQGKNEIDGQFRQMKGQLLQQYSSE